MGRRVLLTPAHGHAAGHALIAAAYRPALGALARRQGLSARRRRGPAGHRARGLRGAPAAQAARAGLHGGGALLRRGGRPARGRARWRPAHHQSVGVEHRQRAARRRRAVKRAQHLRPGAAHIVRCARACSPGAAGGARPGALCVRGLVRGLPDRMVPPSRIPICRVTYSRSRNRRPDGLRWSGARAARLAQVVLGVCQARLAGLAGAQVPRDDLLALGRRCALRTAGRSDAAARAARDADVLIPHPYPKYITRCWPTPIEQQQLERMAPPGAAGARAASSEGRASSHCTSSSLTAAASASAGAGRSAHGAGLGGPASAVASQGASQRARWGSPWGSTGSG